MVNEAILMNNKVVLIFRPWERGKEKDKSRYFHSDSWTMRS